MYFITLKPQFYVLLPGKGPPKSLWGKISYVKFGSNYEKVDNFRQGVTSFDIKLK